MLINQALSCTCTHHSPYFHTQVASTTDDMPSKVMPSVISYSIHLLLPTLLVLLLLSSSSTHAFHASTPDGQKTNVVFVIDEESPVGSRIGSLAEKLALDITSRGEVNFVPLTDLRLVKFNRTSGLITVKQRIDREGLCKEIGACCPGQSILPTSPLSTFHDPLSPDVQYSGCAIKMLVMDQRQRNSNTPLQNQEHPLIQVVIYVNDLNDNPPFWSPDKLELEIPEHTVIGRKFQLPEATDPDHGPEYTVQNYRLIPSEPLDHDPSIRGIVSDAFELTSELIERTPGSPYKFSLGLKVKADLDREKQSAYYFLLIATDGGSPQLTGTLSVIVRITDINDQTPYFRQNNPSVEISENITPGTQIFTAVALDDDPSDANRLEYRIGSTASAEVQRLFTIDSRTGAVSVSGEVDYESAPILPSRDAKDSMYSSNNEYGYIIPIEVTDQAHIAETKLRVHVLNANDNHPVISIQSPLQNSASKGEFYIREDAPVGTLVATITISDADERGGVDPSYPNRQPDCKANNNAYFTVEKLHPTIRNLFKLVTSKPLDHETKSTHGITITCYDSGQPVLDTKKHITVRLEDVNDSPPVFEKSIYYARISEGLPVHTPIIKVHASDTDTGEMGDVHYRFVEEIHQMDYDPMVILDEKTGQIRSGKVFDREVIKSFNFTVEAVDCGGGNKSLCGGRVNTATAEVIVQIEDINDCAPEFDQQSYEFIIQECHISKILVGKVHASDRDADGKNNRVRYQISDEGNSGLEGFRTSRLFSITPSGEIYTNSVPIDREQVPMLTFSVVATDNGEPSLSAFATVVIRVEDINDNGPQWIFPPPGPQAASINISVHSTIGMVIARLEAVDPDVGPNGQVEYEVIRGNSQKYFDLDSLSGTLYLAKQFEINTDGNGTNGQNTPTSFALSLKASDNGEPQKSNTSLLRIIVQSDDNLNQPHDGSRVGGKNQHLTNSHFKQQNGFFDRDLLVMVVMIIIILLVSVIFIIAIVMLRCRQIHSTRENGLEGQGDLGAGGGVGIVRVAQVKPHAWIPPSQESSAKSGFTMESSKSGTGTFDGQSHYTATGHLIAADSTLKSTDGIFDRFSPALIVSHHPSLSTTSFQRTSHSSDPSPTGPVVYTAKTLPGNSSPRYVRQMCSTLPNNATAVTTVGSKNIADASGRCYMTLNPELYEIEYPYGQLKYHTEVYRQSPRRINSSGGGCATLVKSTSNIVDVESPPQVTTFNDSVEVPRGETQKRCRFKIDHSNSRMTPVLGNFDTSESTEETVDGVEVEVDSIQMKRLQNASRNSGGIGEDTLLVDIH